MAQLLQVTPFLHVRELEPALAFFSAVLGFTVPYRERGYAYVQRDGAAYRLLVASEDEAPVGNREITSYVDVRDLDGLYEELRPRLQALPPADVLPPRDQPHGQREFMVRGPDGYVICFGQPVKG